MKKEYDFSNGERGKFYRKNVKLNFPICSEKDVAELIEINRIKTSKPFQTRIARIVTNFYSKKFCAN